MSKRAICSASPACWAACSSALSARAYPPSPSVGATVATSQTTTSTGYADLTTAGPAVTLTIPASGNAPD